ncbi:MAG TPA: helix-hairpin-helix domain-containing protein [Anaerolineales bacterium]|nr:helix-hairpin-helix domain-containing protein [Anaerolineales bacterium]
MKTWQATLFAVLCTLLVTGIVYLVSQPERGAPIQLLPAPTPSPLVIQISGAVHQPGMYPLPAGSRLNDAIQAAGGLLPEADNSQLNLASPLVDGSLVVIPQKSDPDASAITAPGFLPTSQPRSGAIIVQGLLDINRATAGEFESLPEIGPVIAQRIVDYRSANGPFTTLEAIQNVSGIGPAKYEKIKPLITLDPAP